MMHIRRRDFLKILGAAAAGYALKDIDVLWGVPDRLVKQAVRGPGIETFKNTVCQLCPAGCGIKVRLIDGIPVHIDGNPMHPINYGGICPHGAAGLDFLYHPDRLRQPMLNVGRRGGGEWKAVSWEDALANVADRLSKLRRSGSPEQLAFFVREKRGLVYEMISRFSESFGSRNVLELDEGQNDFVPFELLFGWKTPPEYDVENTRFLLSFGADFLEDGVAPLHGIHAYSKMREGTGGGRGKFAYVDSRHSLTAASADVYLPCNPGTHGAFALGVAYVLIRERYYDAAFVQRHVEGFDSWVDEKGETHPGFKDYVLENYYPERVAQITGVPARKIVDVGRDLGRIRPALAMIGPHGTSGTNGLFNALAVLTLNVLIGNIEQKGGLRVQRTTPYKKLAPAQTDTVARAGLGKPALHEIADGRPELYADSVLRFCDHVESGDPAHGIDTLFIYGTNPAFDHPYAKRIRDTLDKIPFIVSFATVMDESSEYADIILPEHAYLERWMDSGSAPGVRFAHASVSQPVVEPLYDTRHVGDVLVDIANRVGGSVAATFANRNFFDTLQDRFQGIFGSGEGAVVSGSFEESWIKFLKERGWQNLVYESFEEFWQVILERGGWWDPVSEELVVERVLQTENGKISLAVKELWRRWQTSTGAGGSAAQSGDDLLAAWGIAERGGAAFLPHFEEPRFAGDESEFPYCLVTFGVLSNRRGSGSFSPLLQEMFGYAHRVYSNSWVEINPETAHRHNIKHGDFVEVSSGHGQVVVRAVFNELLEPRTIAIPFGMGHTSGGRHAKGVGVNPYEIAAQASDRLWGRPVKMTTRVKIHKSDQVG